MELPITPSFRLDAKRALVTGASRGLGLASSVALAAAGAEVTLIARSKEDVEQAALAIRESGGKAVAVVLDIIDVEKTAQWVAKQPAFDILINNAGTNRPRSFTDTTTTDFDEVFAINMRAVYFTTQGVVKRMLLENVRGSIINMSSQMGHIGAADRAVYCASKFAVEGFTRAIAAELGPFGIRANTIAPTFIETAMTKPFLSGAFLEWALAHIKVGRLGRLEDVMGAVVYLASDASALMTGSSQMLDGGWTGTS